MMKKILVVDDDEGILEALSFILEDSGYVVEKTADGKVAPKKALSFQPDLIILDYLLSGIDGLTVCKKIKSDIKTKNIPIILISANPNAKKVIKKCGVNDFIEKPFDIDKLLKKVEVIIKTSDDT